MVQRQGGVSVGKWDTYLIPPPGANAINLFLCSLSTDQIKPGVIPGKSYHLSLIFVSYAIDYPSGAPSLLGLAPGLAPNIRLDWKGLPGANTLA